MAAALEKRTLPVFVLRLTLAGVFVVAALPKLQDPAGFAASIEAFRVTGPVLSGWIALALPWLELVIGVGLLTPFIRRMSGALINLLLLAFIILHASAWARGLDVNCGCFGAEGEATSDYRWMILRNAALLAAALFVLRNDLRDARRA